ncbi:LacI family DNA-binding transcriptional regulator [Propioniciclava soli]|uniref:LacI family DNA-binding transcriptional regulator n=1 Tax=Propioniciclava soli TaxID=2775081 RepID=UPI001E3904D4|nr:LacI family DNA-binding transcriptional regulator [Propioniciclava soli]
MTTQRQRLTPTAEPNGRRVTILDVATRAGVSPSAVSKVVRNAYGVSPAMRSRVRAAIDDLGYRPHAGARAMRGRSYSIGVVVTDVGSPFQIDVAHRIAVGLESTPYQESITSGGTSAAQYRSRIDALVDRQVDGLVLVAPWIDPAEVAEIAATVPVVTVALHGTTTDFDMVVDDEELGARLVVNHLVELGHRRITLTSMPSLDWEEGFRLSHTARRDGFERAVRAHGLEPDVMDAWYSEDAGYAATLAALDRPQPPTAIFAGADIAALGALRAADERGVHVPDDLTIVGYDNIFAASIPRVSLTTVDASGAVTGDAALRLLLERIEGREQSVQYVVAPQLVVRGTSGPAPASR